MPQAAQIGFNFFGKGKSVMMHLLEGPVKDTLLKR